MNDMVVILGLQLALLLGLAIVAVALCVWVVGQLTRVLDRPTVGPREKLLGQIGRVMKPISPSRRGKVLIMGEIWDAEPLDDAEASAVGKGEEIRVVSFDEIEERVVRVERLK